MDKNGESIYGCGAGTLPKQDWGRYTQKGNSIYAHWLNPYLGDINAKGLDGDAVKNVFMLNSGAELKSYKTWWGNSEPGNFFIAVEKSAQKTDNMDTVIKIELKKQ